MSLRGHILELEEKRRREAEKKDQLEHDISAAKALFRAYGPKIHAELDEILRGYGFEIPMARTAELTTYKHRGLDQQLDFSFSSVSGKSLLNVSVNGSLRGSIELHLKNEKLHYRVGENSPSHLHLESALDSFF